MFAGVNILSEIDISSRVFPPHWKSRVFSPLRLVQVHIFFISFAHWPDIEAVWSPRLGDLRAEVMEIQGLAHQRPGLPPTDQ